MTFNPVWFCSGALSYGCLRWFLSLCLNSIKKLKSKNDRKLRRKQQKLARRSACQKRDEVMAAEACKEPAAERGSCEQTRPSHCRETIFRVFHFFLIYCKRICQKYFVINLNFTKYMKLEDFIPFRGLEITLKIRQKQSLKGWINWFLHWRSKVWINYFFFFF